MTETPTAESSETEGGEAALLRVIETQRALIADLSATVASLRGEKERSEERRVGKECTIQCRSRWSPYH